MRAYRAALGEDELPPWDEAEPWQVESTLAAVRFRMAHPDAPPGVQHEQWMEEKRASGWRHGAVRDNARKMHPMMMPFNDLPDTEKRKDVLIQKVVDAFLEDV
ncbi:RyR domain-containing protein [Alkalicaulis satelles]|nr:RyR domain-containing protein [Alkalicaulis satelles]